MLRIELKTKENAADKKGAERKYQISRGQSFDARVLFKLLISLTFICKF